MGPLGPNPGKPDFSGKIRLGQLSSNIVPQLQAKNQENRWSRFPENFDLASSWFQPPPPCEMGGPEIFVASSPHFKQVFFLMMGGPGLMGGPAFQMGGPAVLTLEIS